MITFICDRCGKTIGMIDVCGRKRMDNMIPTSRPGVAEIFYDISREKLDKNLDYCGSSDDIHLCKECMSEFDAFLRKFTPTFTKEMEEASNSILMDVPKVALDKYNEKESVYQ